MIHFMAIGQLFTNNFIVCSVVEWLWIFHVVSGLVSGMDSTRGDSRYENKGKIEDRHE